MDKYIDALENLFKNSNYKNIDNYINFINTRSYVEYECDNGHYHKTQAKNILYNDKLKCKKCFENQQEIIFSLQLFDGVNKICSYCKETKEKSSFGKSKLHTDGLRPICKLCRRKQETHKRNINPNNNAKINMDKYLLNNPFKFLLSRAKQNHKKKGFLEELNIDAEYLKKIFYEQNQLCYWSNQPLNIKDVGKSKLDTISIDRLDCNKGYIKGNIVICTKFMNLGRGNSTVEEFNNFLDELKKSLK